MKSIIPVFFFFTSTRRVWLSHSDMVDFRISDFTQTLNKSDKVCLTTSNTVFCDVLSTLYFTLK